MTAIASAFDRTIYIGERSDRKWIDNVNSLATRWRRWDAKHWKLCFGPASHPRGHFDHRIVGLPV
jgi:hypothetical protein